MDGIYYKLSENVDVEKMDEGAILSMKGSENVICLGKWELEILNLIVENEFEDVVNKLYDKYQDSSIRADMVDFCNSLSELHILNREK